MHVRACTEMNVFARAKCSCVKIFFDIHDIYSCKIKLQSFARVHSEISSRDITIATAIY